MTEYHIYGRPFAGSLIAEFLLTQKTVPTPSAFLMRQSARHRTFWPKIQLAGSPFWFARMATACLNRWPLFIISQRGLTGWPLPRQALSVIAI